MTKHMLVLMMVSALVAASCSGDSDAGVVDDVPSSEVAEVDESGPRSI